MPTKLKMMPYFSGASPNLSLSAEVLPLLDESKTHQEILLRISS
ncbi:hypothetical protein [Tumidithrix helvetica]